MRIVGGRLRGAGLAGPGRDDLRIRPSSDFLRESLFNILEHWPGGSAVAGARVLDLFAGTGALGLEALSRGARFALFVDVAGPARALVRTNLDAFQLTGIARIFRRDATALGPAGPLGQFSLVFIDPPYGKGLAQAALASAREGGWLAPDALIVVEEARKASFAPPPGFDAVQQRVYGDSELVFLTLAGA